MYAEKSEKYFHCCDSALHGQRLMRKVLVIQRIVHELVPMKTMRNLALSIWGHDLSTEGLWRVYSVAENHFKSCICLDQH